MQPTCMSPRTLLFMLAAKYAWRTRRNGGDGGRKLSTTPSSCHARRKLLALRLLIVCLSTCMMISSRQICGKDRPRSRITDPADQYSGCNRLVMSSTSVVH